MEVFDSSVLSCGDSDLWVILRQNFCDTVGERWDVWNGTINWLLCCAYCLDLPMWIFGFIFGAVRGMPHRIGDVMIGYAVFSLVVCW